jgi:hypothetical protein
LPQLPWKQKRGDFKKSYLVSLDMDVTGNITAKICKVWSEINIFCTLVIMATAPILNFGWTNFAAVAMETKKGRF